MLLDFSLPPPWLRIDGFMFSCPNSKDSRQSINRPVRVLWQTMISAQQTDDEGALANPRLRSLTAQLGRFILAGVVQEYSAHTLVVLVPRLEKAGGDVNYPGKQWLVCRRQENQVANTSYPWLPQALLFFFFSSFLRY